LVYVFLISSMRATCSVSLTLFDLIALILDEEYKL
jgi:hypothetical protein